MYIVPSAGNRPDIDAALSGISCRFDSSRGRPSQWLKSHECRRFLLEAIRHLQAGPSHGDSERIAHYLMGKISRERLPYALTEWAGDWLTASMQMELYGLLRTNRYFSMESSEKTREKLYFLLDKSAITLISQSPSDLERCDSNDLMVLVRIPYPNGGKGDCKDMAQRELLRRYVHEAPVDGDGWRDMLRQCVKGEAPERVEEMLWELLQNSPGMEAGPRSRMAELVQIWLEGLQEMGVKAGDHPNLGRWMGTIFPEVGESSMVRCQPSMLAILQALSFPLESECLRKIISGNLGSKVRQAVLASVVHWTGSLDAPLRDIRSHWEALTGDEQWGVLKAATEFAHSRRLWSADNLKFLAQAFNDGRIRAEHVRQGMGFYIQLFNAAKCPALEFVRHNYLYLARMESSDPTEAARFMYEVGLALPPSPNELHEMACNKLEGESKKIHLEMSPQSILDISKILEKRLYENPMREFIMKRVEDALLQNSLNVSEVIRKEIADVLFNNANEATVASLLKQSLVKDENLKSGTVDNLVAVLKKSNRREALQQFWQNSIQSKDSRALDCMLKLFDQVQNWSIVKNDCLEEAVVRIAGALKQLDDSVQGNFSPHAFSNYVLATMPYRSLVELKAIAQRPGIHKDLKGVLLAACDGLTDFQDEGSASQLMFVGYAQEADKPPVPRFLRVTHLGLLHPNAISTLNMDQFFIRSGGGDRGMLREDLPEMALPQHLWSALREHLPSSLVGQGVHQLMIDLLRASNATLSISQTDLLKGAIQTAVFSGQEFSSSFDDKVSMRTVLHDVGAEDVLLKLLAETKEVAQDNLFRAILSRWDTIPNVAHVDKHVKAFGDAHGKTLAYYMFGILLARLSSSVGLGWDVNANMAASRGVLHNQSIVGLRLLAAYCLSKSREAWLDDDLSGAALDEVIYKLTKTSDCSQVLAGKLYGDTTVHPLLKSMSREIEKLLAENGSMRAVTQPPMLPTMGEDIRFARGLVVTEGPNGVATLSPIQSEQARLPDRP